MRTTRTLLAICALAAAAELAACKKASEEPKPATELQTTTVPGAAMVPDAPNPSTAMAAGHAPAVPAGAATGSTSVTGTIVETMDSGGYTYMRLKLEGGAEGWAAVNQAKVKAGEKVTVVNAMPMDGFESKTLKRKFDRILFGQLPAQAAVGAMPAGAPAGNPGEPDVRAQMAAQHAAVGQAAEVGKIDVPKAEGKDAKRVAEVFAERAKLDGKPVAIRGKVVKFTPGVMGRNWIHLRDGSGSAEKKDNDVTVTTKDGAAVGDVVMVTGKVGLDRDFGMGYAYPILIEEATVTK